jgi:hypothetical protein
MKVASGECTADLVNSSIEYNILKIGFNTASGACINSFINRPELVPNISLFGGSSARKKRSRSSFTVCLYVRRSGTRLIGCNSQSGTHGAPSNKIPFTFGSSYSFEKSLITLCLNDDLKRCRNLLEPDYK